MRKRIWGFFLCLLIGCAFCAGTVGAWDAGNGGEQQNTAQDPAAELSLYAGAAALLDADSGRVLYGKNADTPMAMASTTKIMTCILVLENVSPEETLTVSAYAAGMPQVKLNLKKGEEYRVGDLLYSLMLESHNDSAVALAEHVGKKFLDPESAQKPACECSTQESRMAVAAFAALMNEKAEALGCRNTWFITPNGLDAVEEVVQPDGSLLEKEHCTTAAELAAIMAYCIKKSPQSGEFLNITQTPSYSFYANGRNFTCVNHNAFLNMMDGALSGKTGFTNKAGYCYVGALESEGRTFVVALLACGWPNHKTYKWSDTAKLMEYGKQHFFYRSFTEKGVAFDAGRLQPIPVERGRTDVLGAVARVGLEVAQQAGKEDGSNGGSDGGEKNAACTEGLLLREDEQIQVTCTVQEALTAPVPKGQTVGRIEYSVNGVVYRSEPIVTSEAVEEIDLFWCLEQVFHRFLIREGQQNGA